MSTILRTASLITKPIYGGIGHILMFHRVCPPSRRAPGSSQIETTPEQLAAIIQFFTERHYAFVSLDEVCESLQEKKIDHRFVAFTFDDGYVDIHSTVYPILKQSNIPFAVYLITDFPDNKAVLWWYLLDDLILEQPAIRFEWKQQPYSFDCSTPHGQAHANATLKKLIKSTGPKEQPVLFDTLFTPYHIDLNQKTGELALSWQQIEQLDADELVTIGAHTVTHPVLANLGGSDVRDEISISRQKLQAHLIKPIHHFAYPYGGMGEAGWREVGIVKELDFKSAVTTRCGNIQWGHRQYPECLPRLNVPALGSLDNLELAINGLIPARKNRFKRLITC
ncbi:MAG: polysaccharide deacetylase family protein [Anaerolineaceae bacterium]|jgi:peptidoglycan/xylan/chitin deacetylase (PgdA/CDA1 family)